MENEKSIIPSDVTNEDIKNLIYTIRGKQVMLDSDVAMLYHYETKRINETVNRNKARFPENFCFQLTESEMENLRCQFVTLSPKSNMRSHLGPASNDEMNWSQNVTSSESVNMRSQNVISSSDKNNRSQFETSSTIDMQSQFATASDDGKQQT